MRKKLFFGAIAALLTVTIVSACCSKDQSQPRTANECVTLALSTKAQQALVYPDGTMLPASTVHPALTQFTPSATPAASASPAVTDAPGTPPAKPATVSSSASPRTTSTLSPDCTASPQSTRRPPQPKPQLSLSAQRKKLIWLGWTEFESGESSWSLTASDGGHAYGRYQFDDRHSLAEFLRFCVNSDRENFESFTTFYEVVGGKAKIKNTERLPEEWAWICHLKKEAFYQLQTEFALKAYYRPARKTIKTVAKVDINDYSPVLRGTVMSIAIRDGHYANNLTSVTRTYYRGISEREWLAEIYAAEAARHDDQVDRWAGRQKQAALAALRRYEAAETERALRKLQNQFDFEPVL